MTSRCTWSASSQCFILQEGNSFGSWGRTFSLMCVPPVLKLFFLTCWFKKHYDPEQEYFAALGSAKVSISTSTLRTSHDALKLYLQKAGRMQLGDGFAPEFRAPDADTACLEPYLASSLKVNCFEFNLRIHGRRLVFMQMCKAATSLPILSLKACCVADMSIRSRHAELAFSRLTCQRSCGKFLSVPECTDGLWTGDDAWCSSMFMPEVTLT